MKVMQMRQLSVLLVLGSMSTGALASYELAMYTTSNGAIARYDPVNRVSLGTFGSGISGWYANNFVTKDASRPGEVAVLNADGFNRWINYSTGVLKGQFDTRETPYSGLGPLNHAALSNGNYLITGYGGAVASQKTRLMTNTGVVLSTLSPFGATYVPLSATQGTDGNIYQLVRKDIGSGFFNFYSFVYNSIGSYLGSNDVGVDIDQYAYGNVVATNGRVYYSSSANTSSLYLKSQANGTAQSMTGLTSSSYSIAKGWTNMAVGHNGNLHLIQSIWNGTNYTNKWYTYDRLANVMAATHDLPTTGYAGSLTMVIAPEPGTWGVLALGSLVLVRRRRRA